MFQLVEWAMCALLLGAGYSLVRRGVRGTPQLTGMWETAAQRLDWERPYISKETGEPRMEGLVGDLFLEARVLSEGIMVGRTGAAQIKAPLSPGFSHIALAAGRSRGRDPEGFGRVPAPTGDAAFDSLAESYGPADRVLAAFDSELRLTIGTAVSAFGGGPSQWEEFGRDGGMSIMIRPDQLIVTVPNSVSTDLVETIHRVARLAVAIQSAADRPWLSRLRERRRDPLPSVRANVEALETTKALPG